MENKSLALKSILTLSGMCFFIAFLTCNNKHTTLGINNAVIDCSSVSLENGIYKIDSALARSNGNKLKLLKTLEKEKLIEKKTMAEIPGFIGSFLDSISPYKRFDRIDPETEWQTGGWLIGLNEQQKKTLHAISSVARPFSSKQIAYFGIGENIALLSYYTGGIRMTQHMMIIKFRGKHIVDLWFGDNSFDYDQLNGQSNFVTSGNEIIKYLKTSRSRNC